MDSTSLHVIRVIFFYIHQRKYFNAVLLCLSLNTALNSPQLVLGKTRQSERNQAKVICLH